MKKVLLALALIPALVACSGNIGENHANNSENSDIIKGKMITKELLSNEYLYVDYNSGIDSYSLGTYGPYSSKFGTDEPLTRISYTYWENLNALDIDTNLGLIQYRGLNFSWRIITVYANQD